MFHGSRVPQVHWPRSNCQDTQFLLPWEQSVQAAFARSEIPRNRQSVLSWGRRPPDDLAPKPQRKRQARNVFSSTHLAAAPLAIARKPGKHRQYVVVSMFSSRRVIPRTSSMLHDRETDRSPQRWVHVWSEATARRPVNGQIGHALIMMSARCKTSSHLKCFSRYSCAVTSDRVRQRCSPARRLLWKITCCALPLAPAIIRREELLASPCRGSAKERFS